MVYWESGGVLTWLVLALLLLGAAGLRLLIPPLRRLGMPDSMVAGTLGFVFGPSVLGLVPFDPAVLESIVYHGLALMFIAVALKEPPKGGAGSAPLSFTFGIPFFAVLQGAIGLGAVLIFTSLRGTPLHPGFGLLLPLGFSQGPGQALSMGQAWEASGLTDGTQVGLIIAAMGFAWAVFFGVPLVAIGKRLGWAAESAQDEAYADDAEQPLPIAAPGGLEAVTVHMAVIGGVYILTFGAITGLTGLLAGKPQLVAMIFGFHFLIGSILALLLRSGLKKGMGRYPFHSDLMGRLSGLIVDVVTCAALAAIAMRVLEANLLPILVITSVGGFATLLGCLWFARRAFPEAPFENAVLLFGASTGTLPTGMALLRILDPELRGPAASNAVLGATAAVIPGAPLLLVVLPHTLSDYPANFPQATWESFGMVCVYLVVLVIAWRLLGPLRLLKPLTSIWPRQERED